MKDEHITKIIDETGFANLNVKDLALIKSHVANCSDCRKSFQAARISTILLRAHSSEQTSENTHLPSTFFQARVLNALREKQNSIKAIGAFRCWWQASALMVGLMLMMVAGLAAMTLLAPFSSGSDVQAGMSGYNLYSTDTVILNQKIAPELTTEQVFQILDDTRNDSR